MRARRLLPLVLFLTACGRGPADGSPQSAPDRSAKERWELLVAPFADWLRGVETGEIQEVVRHRLPRDVQGRGPEAAATRSGADVVRARVALGEGEVARIRRFLTTPEAFVLEGIPRPTSHPERVLLLRSGERMVKVAVHLEEAAIVVSAGPVVRLAALKVGPEGRAELEWLGTHPVVR